MDLIKQLNEAVSKSLTHLKEQYANVGNDISYLGIIENLNITDPDYGTMSLSGICLVSKIKNMIVIKPYEKRYLKPIQTAVATTGLNPYSDGHNVNAPIPAMTGENRAKLVKQLSKMADDAKVSLRNIRRDFIDKAKQEKSEDVVKKLKSQIDELTHKTEQVIDTLFSAKSAQVSK